MRRGVRLRDVSSVDLPALVALVEIVHVRVVEFLFGENEVDSREVREIHVTRCVHLDGRQVDGVKVVRRFGK